MFFLVLWDEKLQNINKSQYVLYKVGVGKFNNRRTQSALWEHYTQDGH